MISESSPADFTSRRTRPPGTNSSQRALLDDEQGRCLDALRQGSATWAEEFRLACSKRGADNDEVELARRHFSPDCDIRTCARNRQRLDANAAALAEAAGVLEHRDSKASALPASQYIDVVLWIEDVQHRQSAAACLDQRERHLGRQPRVRFTRRRHQDVVVAGPSHRPRGLH
jgi:hypothetical protein